MLKNIKTKPKVDISLKAEEYVTFSLAEPCSTAGGQLVVGRRNYEINNEVPLIIDKPHKCA